MQEEVEQKTVNLAVTTTKVSARTIIGALRWYVAHHDAKKMQKAAKSQGPIKGKQKVKDLINSGASVDSIDMAKTSMKDFEKIFKKLGIDYAIKKDKTQEPPRYVVFFKAKDNEVLKEALAEYATLQEQKKEKQSAKEDLKQEKAKLKAEKKEQTKQKKKQKVRKKEQNRGNTR